MANGTDVQLFDTDLQDLLDRAERRLQKKSQMAVKEKVPQRYDQMPSYDPEKCLVKTPYISLQDGVARMQTGPHALESSRSSSDSLIRRVEDPVLVKDRAKKKKTVDAGADWYHIPRTKMTAATKRDFQLLQMRNVLDSHRHYRKSDNAGKFPEYSQTGTIVEGATEFYSGRIVKRDRKQTLAEEILATEDVNRKFKAKYSEIQAKKVSGKKAHYKARMARRARNQPR